MIDDNLGNESAPDDRRLQDLPLPAGRRGWPAPADPALRGPVASRLGPCDIDNTDTRHRIEKLALSLQLQEDNAAGLACFGPCIRDKPFTKGFTLPRNTPKFNDTIKTEDWLTDYSTVVGIAGGNRRLAVRYAPLMLQGLAWTWLNSLPAGSINVWLNLEKVFVLNFNGTYKRQGRPSQLTMCI